jgi:hypothetical protein
MATSYPTSVQALVAPTSTTKQNDVGFELDVVILTVNDTVEAVQTKLGIGASAQTPAANTVLGGNGAGTTSFRQVETGDIATDAVTQVVQGGTFSSSTTSTTYVDLTTTGVTQTTTGGKLECTVVWCGNMTAASNSVFLALSLDGAAEVSEVVQLPANALQFVMVCQALFTGVSAASHTVKARWKVGGSTANTYSGTLKVKEVKK